MKFRWDNRYLHWGVTAFLVIAASMLFYYGIFHMKTLIVGIKTFLGIMAPIIYGVILAYILSPLINLFEQKLIYPQLEKHNIKLQKKGKRAIRWGCVLFSMFLFWIIIYALLMMVLPQLIRSIMSIIYSFPYYIKVIEKWLNSFVEHGWKLNPEMLDMINQYSVKAQEYLTTDILPQMQDMLKNVSAGIFDILIFMKNILISVIIGVTNVIPFFGPYIGAIPCILLILVVDPIKGLYFAIFILLLQQFDGNILGPKILGDSTGLSSFMVIVAIMIGGGLFGVPGMIAGVPVFAVLYALIWRLINHSLNDKKMPAEEETYINIDCLDEQTGEVLPLCKEEKHKVSPEELEARKNNFFMKIWNPLSGLVITIWKYLLRILNIIWGYIKKAGIFLKNRYVELKNKREKNK